MPKVKKDYSKLVDLRGITRQGGDVMIYGRRSGNQPRNARLEFVPIKHKYIDRENRTVHFYSPHHKTNLSVPIVRHLGETNNFRPAEKEDKYLRSAPSPINIPEPKAISDYDNVLSRHQAHLNRYPFASYAEHYNWFPEDSIRTLSYDSHGTRESNLRNAGYLSMSNNTDYTAMTDNLLEGGQVELIPLQNFNE